MTIPNFFRASFISALVIGTAAPALAAPATPPAPVAEVGPDGVGMLFPSEPSGSSFYLGDGDPSNSEPFFNMKGDEATPGLESGVPYWSTPGHRVTYASGKPAGKTVRLHLRPSGGEQSFTWRDGALENGFIGSPDDLLNFEATVYVRVHEDNGTHHSMSWKMRGGQHTKPEVARSSCVGMDVPFGGASPQAYRELDHPTYDFLSLTPYFDYQLQEGRWLGVKVVSYLVEGGTRNLLFLDTNPFDASGKPRNEFRLFTEWHDRDGESTGHYDRAATWAGLETTFRVDGWRRVDFAYPSAREIVPPTP
ncbi:MULTISPECIES: hypothetical protein [Myxococcus]|uniref:hypothetical protein n=1 Tax=Myxococcus TaxID=32 RepID=UPI0011449FBB|nr:MULTISPECIES: hypothetical protein [Myxococcus]NOK04410.1 hypothetical protein [Myxococcus xanthus]